MEFRTSELTLLALGVSASPSRSDQGGRCRAARGRGALGRGGRGVDAAGAAAGGAPGPRVPRGGCGSTMERSGMGCSS